MEQLDQWVFAHKEIIVLLALWALPWKGVALWKAAHRQEKWWFVALLVVNTLALLEIFYIFYWTKRKKSNSQFRSI